MLCVQITTNYSNYIIKLVQHYDYNYFVARLISVICFQSSSLSPRFVSSYRLGLVISPLLYALRVIIVLVSLSCYLYNYLTFCDDIFNTYGTNILVNRLIIIIIFIFLYLVLFDLPRFLSILYQILRSRHGKNCFQFIPYFFICDFQVFQLPIQPVFVYNVW